MIVIPPIVSEEVFLKNSLNLVAELVSRKFYTRENAQKYLQFNH